MYSFNRYVYDAFGRRLKKTVQDATSKKHITYFGWDGDQHVHTEHLKDDGTREIEHIIYEPGSFTPLVRLSATRQGPYRKELTAMERAATFSDNEQQALAGLAIMRKAERDLLEASMGEFMKTGLPPATAALLGPEIAAQMNKMLASMAQAQADERAAQSANVQIHFYHCDHLGTPLALTDRKGKIVWAIRLDPFGKELAEFNPNGMEQNIRLPGQYLDRETGLHYNRFRYYDPSIGAYITQDPIGLAGGLNPYAYVGNNPMMGIDPLGLAMADRLSIEEMEGKIDANNHSGQSNNLILCIAYKESTFDPTAQNEKGTARGLLQILEPTIKISNKWHGTSFEYSKMTDPDKNIEAGTTILAAHIESASGNVWRGVQTYGTGKQYSDSIKDCTKCLDDCKKNGLTCEHDGKQNCLTKAKAKK